MDDLTAARAAMDGFMAAFNAEDAEALRTTWFHFPHVRFHSGQGCRRAKTNWQGRRRVSGL